MPFNNYRRKECHMNSSINPYRLVTLKPLDYLILYYIKKSNEITLEELKDIINKKYFPKERSYLKKRVDILHKKAHYIRTTLRFKYIGTEHPICLEYYVLTPEGKELLKSFSKLIKMLPIK